MEITVMMTPDHGEIAKRAYRIWEIEGRPDGRDLDIWLRAEAEVQAECTRSPEKTSPEAESAEVNPAPVKRQRAGNGARRTRRSQ